MSEAELNFLCFPQISSRQKWPKNFLESEGSVEVTGPPQPVLLRLQSKSSPLETSEIAKHAVKLNQQKASLQEKRTILRQLDMEILTLADEAEIEAEIERADLVEENIQLAIANIDHALSSNANTNDVVANLPAQPNVSESTSTEEGPVRASKGQNENSSSLPSALGQNENGSSPLSASGQNEKGSSPPSASGQNENGSSPPSASLADSSASTPRKTQVKLTKLELKKFDGDHSKWISFWDTFEASVHKNESLSAIDKFNYLISRLKRSAAEAISGLTLTASNYDEAI